MASVGGLGSGELVALAVGALLVGFAKTGIGGVGAISVAIFAAVLPARESTGALLPLLLVGDLVAVRAYRQHADWRVLVRLFPFVALGVLAGAVFVAGVDDTVMRRTIGALLLALIAVHVWQRRRAVKEPDEGVHRRSRTTTVGFGLLAGFATMVANAGGAAMSLYLLSAGMGILGFLGTGAWFFFVVNAFKVPFSVGLGLLDGDTLVLCALLAPAVLLGAVAGRAAIKRIDRARFEQLVVFFTVVSSINLLR